MPKNTIRSNIQDISGTIPVGDRKSAVDDRRTIDALRRRIDDSMSFKAGDNITTSGRKDQTFNTICANCEFIEVNLQFPSMG